MNSIVILTEKVDNFDFNYSALGTRLDKIEITLSNKIEKIKNQLQEIDDKSELEKVRLRFEML